MIQSNIQLLVLAHLHVCHQNRFGVIEPVLPDGTIMELRIQTDLGIAYVQEQDIKDGALGLCFGYGVQPGTEFRDLLNLLFEVIRQETFRLINDFVITERPNDLGVPYDDIFVTVII